MNVQNKVHIICSLLILTSSYNADNVICQIVCFQIYLVMCERILDKVGILLRMHACIHD